MRSFRVPLFASVFAGFALTAVSPALLAAQRGGGRGGDGPDNRPEVTFPVNIPKDDAKLAALKKEAMHMVDSMATFTQQMVDMVFSFGELGFQEEETSKYLTGILEKNGFKVTRGVAGIPTAWTATWGSGKPVISLGSDVDDIPQANQKPGVGYKDPMITGAPGHGEGHNAGVPMNITAAIAVKKIMEREKMPGTIHLWPGIAEEQMAAKAYFVRAGVFKDVDAVLFAHIGSDLGVSYGQSGQSALISARFDFAGSSAHAAGAPWSGRSALDAVELMDVAWNFRREHLPLTQRSHYVITDGGDQPNVVPPKHAPFFRARSTERRHSPRRRRLLRWWLRFIPETSTCFVAHSTIASPNRRARHSCLDSSRQSMQRSRPERSAVPSPAPAPPPLPLPIQIHLPSAWRWR